MCYIECYIILRYKMITCSIKLCYERLKKLKPFILKLVKLNEVSRCPTVVYCRNLKLCVRHSTNFSKLHQIYQDIILTPTLSITPYPNNGFENFWLLVKRGLYFRYFYVFSTIQYILCVKHFSNIQYYRCLKFTITFVFVTAFFILKWGLGFYIIIIIFQYK